MTHLPTSRPLWGMIAIAVAATGAAAYFGLVRSIASDDIPPTDAVTVPPATASREPAARTAAAAAEPASTVTDGSGSSDRAPTASPIVRPSPSRRTHTADVAGSTPSPLIELATTTSWDEHASAVLERCLAATFDTDGDGALDDFERITAVQALRDAVWPSAATLAAELPEQSFADATPMTLSDRDRRLHHNVDQERRRDREEHGPGGDLSNELRGEVLRRFQVDDDGHLTVAEFARYMVRHNAGSATADLNGDGQVDDADLRVYLDVTSPIDGP